MMDKSTVIQIFSPGFFDEKSYTDPKLLNGSVDTGKHFVDDHRAKSLTNTTSLVSYFVLIVTSD